MELRSDYFSLYQQKIFWMNRIWVGWTEGRKRDTLIWELSVFQLFWMEHAFNRKSATKEAECKRIGIHNYVVCRHE